jgi:Fic family protein
LQPLAAAARQPQGNHKDYYDQLNRGQRGDKDVTEWVRWIVGRCADAYAAAAKIIDEALEKQRFWQNHLGTPFKERQRKVLQRLLDAGDGGFDDGLNAEKYIKLTGASKATATRDLAEMVRGGQLWKLGEGKAVRYHLNHVGWRRGVMLPEEPREAGSV